jgi:biotin carboxyl carrier protein
VPGSARPSPAARPPAAPAGEASPRTLTAPIPGTVVSVAARVGQVVQRGDELLTIEAMKMFNVIRAPWAGTVEAVQTAEGRRVAQGELLMTFAPS